MIGPSPFISRRLSLGGRNKVAAIIAVAGVTCAVMVMILTLAVSAGFKHQIKERLHGFTADISVLPEYRYDTGLQDSYLTITPEITKTVDSVVGKSKRAAVLRQPGILKTDDDFSAVIFTAFDANRNTDFEKGNIVNGIWPDFNEPNSDNPVVISQTTANRLQLKVGDRITACFFANDAVKSRRFTIVGLFTSNFGEYDKTIAYCGISPLRKICSIDSLSASAYEVYGIPEDSIASYAEKLQNTFVNKVQYEGLDAVPVVDNLTHSGLIYLNWLELLNTNVVVIFIIMCCVAAFTIISSLFILILNGIPTIGILRALGASKSTVRNIFIRLTMRLVGLGIIFGNIFAIALLWLQQKYAIIPLDPEMYYLSAVPVHINGWAFATIDVGTLLVAWLVLVLPARMASAVSPAKTMRYE